MSYKPFEQLTTDELDQYSRDLDRAMEHHAAWLARVHRSLLGRCDPDPDDLAPEPDRLCSFGRWYHGLDHSPLHEIPAFVSIEESHRDMHQVARDLLLRRLNAEPFQTNTYDRMIGLSDQLRHLTAEVREALQSSFSLVARLMANVFENSTEGVVITTPDATILTVNAAFTEVTGYTAEEVIGQTPRVLYSGRQSEDFYRRMWGDLTKKGGWQGEIWNRRKNGDIYLEWLTINALRSEKGEITHYVAIFSDITSEKETEERLHYLAHYDPLTGLSNRVLFQDRFKSALARARRNGSMVAVLFMDLDGFKEVNDTLGHNAGDMLLSLVAGRLGGLLRETDTVGRLGGDEFAIVVPDITGNGQGGARSVAEKVIVALSDPFDIDGQKARVSASVGISLYPTDGLDVDNLINRADKAMYEAKRTGKNRFVFYHDESVREAG
jgi:diguanylate cyclase (GGDEF)-like protein/PAS domain S-box-containing protein